MRPHQYKVLKHLIPMVKRNLLLIPHSIFFRDVYYAFVFKLVFSLSCSSFFLFLALNPSASQAIYRECPCPFFCWQSQEAGSPSPRAGYHCCGSLRSLLPNSYLSAFTKHRPIYTFTDGISSALHPLACIRDFPDS